MKKEQNNEQNERKTSKQRKQQSIREIAQNFKAKDNYSIAVKGRTIKQAKTTKVNLANNRLKVIFAMYTLIVVISCAVFSVNLLLNNKQHIQNVLAANKLNMNYTEVGEDDYKTQSEFVEFDAYFLQGSKKVRGVASDLNERPELNLYINVLTNGHLEDGKIVLNSGNYQVVRNIQTDAKMIASVEENNTRIALRQSVNGSTATIPVLIGQNVVGNRTCDKSKLSNVNSVTFTGTHVKDDGTRTNIEKTVNFQVDWYGEKYLNEIRLEKTSYVANKESDKVILSLQAKMWAQDYNDTNIQAPDKAAVFTGIMPKLNGYAPEVTVTDVSTPGKILNYEYNESTGALTVREEIKYNENNIGEKSIPASCYNIAINLVYPYNAYAGLGPSTRSMSVTMNGYLEGYNNPNPEFKNPVTSQTGSKTININLKNPQGDIIIYETDIDLLTKAKLRIKYDKNIELDNGYRVTWKARLNYPANIQKLIFEEDNNSTQSQDGRLYLKEQMQDVYGNFHTLDEIVSYKGIKVPEASFKVLGEGGYINVINATTGEIIKKLTANDADTYIEYSEKIEHIKIETSIPKAAGEVNIYHYKKIDNDAFVAKFPDKNQLNDMTLVYTALNGKVEVENETELINRDIASTPYEDGTNLVYVEPTMQLNTQMLNEKVVWIELKADSNYTDDKNLIEWLNPTIIMEYPEEIDSIDIKDIFSQDGELALKEVTQDTINGKKVIKITTEGITQAGTKIAVSQDIRVNPTTQLATGKLRVFAYNELCDEWHYIYTNTQEEPDIYDINENGDTGETRKVSITELIYSKPVGLYTNTEAVEFDDKGTIIMGPGIAEVEKQRSGTEAKVRLNVYNNYNTAVTNAKIVGKIPFEGNTYQVNGGDIGSNFSVTMKAPGIILPASIASKAKVYYSTKETVNENKSDATNNWVLAQDVQDWSQIKTYLIDLEEVTMEPGESYTIDYKIGFPTELNYGTVTYATHAIYFEEKTADNETVPIRTETNKVGFSVISPRDYKLQLTKMQKGDTKTIPGVIYKLTGPGKNGITYVTNAKGQITINNLYPDEIYTLTEESAPTGYIKSEEAIKIQTYIEEGILKARLVEGTVKGQIEVEGAETRNTTVKIEVENRAKYTLSLTKYRAGTNSTIKGVRFTIKGKGFAEAGKIVQTNMQGKLNITGLVPGEIYELTETSKVLGYVQNATPVKFRADENESGELKITIISGAFKEEPTVNNQTRTVEVGVNNVANYELEIIKNKEGTSELIQGVQFTLKEKETQKVKKIVTTNSSGKAVFDTLEPEKVYILQETKAKEGYLLEETPIEFSANYVNGKLQVTIDEKYKEATEVVEITDTKPAKVQLNISNEQKYNLNIIKYQKGTTNTIQNVSFNLKGEGLPEEGLDRTTDGSGKIMVSNLIPGKQYTLIETKTTGSYVLNTEAVIFTVQKTSEGKLEVIVNGQAKGKIEQATEGKMPQVTLEIENEPKYNLKITKYEKNSDKILPNVQFLVKGKGFTSQGITYTTDSNGVINIPKLELGETYTIKETYAKGYYVDEQEFTVTVTRENEKLQLQYNGRNVKQDMQPTISQDENGFPVINIALENEKIPSYSLELTKKGEKGSLLKNAKFKIEGAGREKDETYITAENGKLTIENLYENEEYTLKEVGAPVGYKLSEIPVKFMGTQENGIWNIEVTEGQFDITGIVQEENPSVEGSIMKATWVNELLFKLQKIDEKTNEPLEGAKFTITDLSGNYVQDLNGNIVGEEETINGEQMYVLTTDENGMLTAELDTGLYEVTEVQAPIGYQLPDRRVKYVGINDSQAEEGYYQSVWGTVLGENIDLDDPEIPLLDNQQMERISTGTGVTTKVALAKTQDGGYIVNATINEEPKLIKYNSNNEIEWQKSSKVAKKIINTEDEGYLTIGNVESPEGTYITKYRKNGEIEWSKTTNGKIAFEDVTETDTEYMVVGNIQENVTLENGTQLNCNYSNEGVIIKYTKTGEITASIKAKDKGFYRNYVQGAGNVIINSLDGTEYEDGYEVQTTTASYEDGLYVVTKTSQGGYLIGGYFIDSNNRKNGIIIKYNIANEEEWVRVIRTELQEDSVACVEEIIETENGSYLSRISSNTVSGIVKYNTNGTVEKMELFEGSITSIGTTQNDGFLVAGTFDGGMLIRYNSENNIEWTTTIGQGTELNDVIELRDGSYMAGGTLNGEIQLDTGDTLSSSNQSGMLIKYVKEVTQVGVPQTQEITFKNAKKKYHIYTKVEGIGGNISGYELGEEALYETVEYKANSNKQIEITPDKTNGYEIATITINGKEIYFTPREDGSYTLEQFTNMSEDKHIVVTFTNNPAKVIVHYVDKQGNPLANETNIPGYIGKNYQTEPATIKNYQVIKGYIGEPTQLENTSSYPEISIEGAVQDTMNEQEHHVTYVYEVKDTKVVVRHYKEPTEEGQRPEDLLLMQEEQTHKVGENYETNYKVYDEKEETLAPFKGYRVVESKMPENKTGIATEEIIYVDYYYALIPMSKVIVNHYIEGTNQRVVDKGVEIPQEVIEGEIGTTTKTYAKLDLEDYKLVEGMEQETTETFVEDEIHVDYYYKLKKAQVIIHHYVEGTEDPVIDNGVELTDDPITGEIGTPYETNPKTNLVEYELVEELLPEDREGTIPEGGLEIIYYYRVKQVKITTEVEGIGGTISGQDEDPYELVNYNQNSIQDIIITPDTNYRVSKIVMKENKTDTVQTEIKDYTINSDGSILLEKFTQMVTNKHIVVSFEKIPAGKIIVKHVDFKTGNSLIPQDIALTGEIGEGYTTNRLEIEDYKPYGANPINSSGVFKEQDQEVIYYYIRQPMIETRKEMETQKGLNYVVEGEKITYKIIIENKGGETEVLLQDKIPEGLTLEKATVKVNGESSYNVTATDIQQGIMVNIPAKTKDEKENEVIGKVELILETTVDNLPEGVYAKQLVNTAVVDGTPTNSVETEVVKPNLKFSKEANPKAGTPVTNKDKITYTIKLKNDGESSITVAVKDTVPTGTTFVANSIQIDGSSIYTLNGKEIDLSQKGESDLSKGIYVEVPAGEEKNVSFTVEVTDLEDGITIKNVGRINKTPIDPENPDNPEDPEKPTYPDEPTNEVEHQYVEPNITVRKEVSTQNDLNYVTKGDIITYNIEVTNSGNLSGVVTVKDKVPEGTSFVEGSVRVNGETTQTIPEHKEYGETVAEQIINVSTKTAEELKNGIKIYVGAKEETSETPAKTTLSFSVTVNDNASGDIKNKGAIKEVPTNKPETPENPDDPEEKETNEVITPVVTYEKKAQVNRTTIEEQTKVSEGAVTANDEIIYTIKVVNTGSKLLDEEGNVNLTKNVAEDIKVKDTVPEGTRIKTVVEDGVTKYSVTGNGTVKDEKEITWNIDELQAGEEINLSFTVIVNYNQENMTIRNTAYINDDKPTNETDTPYEKPESTLTTTLAKTGDEKVTSVDNNINYNIAYTATIKDFVGKAKIKLVDNLPYPIDEAKSNLAGGKYEEDDTKAPGEEGKYKIVWEETVEDINTYESLGAKEITISKEISLKYIYTDVETLNGEINNKVKVVTDLVEPREPSVEDPSTEETVKTEEKEDDHTLVAELPAEVIVHHYIYNEKAKTEEEKYTTVKLTDDERKTGTVGDSYETEKSNKIPSNYTWNGEIPENHEGTMTNSKVEVNYYYKLIDETVTNEMTKTATADKEVERDSNATQNSEGAQGENNQEAQKVKVAVLTEEGGKVTYTISYKVAIKDYIGKAKVSIVDTLPASINLDKSNLAGGNYNANTKTITWNQTIENIDTFANGTYEEVITKQIEVVYEGQNKAQDLNNKAIGSITTYYPENHPVTENTPDPEDPDKVREKQTVTDEDEEVVEQEYKLDKTVQKIWEDAKYAEENRPTQIKVVLKNKGAVIKEQIINASNVNETNSNIWEHTFRDLPKYDSLGNEIEYEVDEVEVENGDLAYYEKQINSTTNIITNTYIGPIISSKKEVVTQNNLSYVVEGETITYKIIVENAGGMAKQVVIKDNVPEGTTFVEGSVKVNGNSSYELPASNISGENQTAQTIDLSTKTAEGLKNGITVNVPAKVVNEGETTNGKVELTFEVTVNNLPEGTYTKQLKNIATIDDEPTNETTTIVNKSNIIFEKSVTPEGTVKVGDELTYTIKLTNKGTASEKVKVQDTVPEGTTFVENSITVEISGEQTTQLYSKEQLEQGIEVELQAETQANISFKVKVNKGIENKANIKNVAIVNDTPTNETENTVVKPVIETLKTQSTNTGLNYVTKGDVITYNIEVTNSGNLGSVVTVKDNVPEGTSFVEGSIRVNEETLHTIPEHKENGETIAEQTINVSTKTAEDLKNGIKLYIVGAKEETSETQAKTTLSFSVTVNEDAIGDIKNKASIKEENPNKPGTPENPDNPDNPDIPEEKETNEVIMPVVTYEKKAQVNRTTAEEQAKVPEGAVTANDEIIYTIKVVNTGSKLLDEEGNVDLTKNVAEDIKVKDTVPEGTRIKKVLEDGTTKYSVSDNGTVKGEKEITWAIDELQAGEEKTLSFTVIVNYSKDNISIRNTAYVNNDKPTNEVETPYEKPESTLETTVEKTGDEKVTSADSSIYYEIAYTANIENFVGKAKIKLVDNLPYPIDIAKSNIAGGKYEEDDTKAPGEEGKYKIVWEETVEDINTYESLEAKGITISKEISLKYIYTDIETLNGEIDNKVKVITDLVEPKEETPEDPSTEKKVKTDEKEDDHTVIAELPAGVVVHHYVYNEKAKTEEEKYTTVKLTEDERKTGTVGDSYETEKSNKIPSNYTWNGEMPENHEGTMTNSTIEVNYYYKLIDETVTNEMTKTATADKEVEREVSINNSSKIANGQLGNNTENNNNANTNNGGNNSNVNNSSANRSQGNETTSMQQAFESLSGSMQNQVKDFLKGNSNVNTNSTNSNNANNATNSNTSKTNNSINSASTLATQNSKVAQQENNQEEDNQIENSQETQKVKVAVLTTEGGKVTYTIIYKVIIKDYIGKVKLSIVDTLPASINLDKSNIAGGIYNNENKTITWEETAENLDSFANGNYEITMTKQIEVVYEGQNKAQDLTNKVVGSITTYYPENHPVTGNMPDPEDPDKVREKQTVTDEDEEIVAQEYKTDKVAQKVWEDRDNEKQKRPESIKLQLTANGQNTFNDKELENIVLTAKDQVGESGTEANKWEYTFKNLAKYDSQGNEIAYSVIESEVTAGDLSFYEEPKVQVLDKIIVTNSYKLTNTNIENTITKDGTDKITSKDQEVNYNISYKANIKDYIGEAEVTITDTLPCEIDVAKSDLQGGTYDKDARTITWIQNLGHINTTTNETNSYPVSISKNIKVVYKDLDVGIASILNKVKGKIEFTENDTKGETPEVTKETEIDIKGKVIVKYVDKETGKEITYTVKPGEPENEDGKEPITKTHREEIEGKVNTDYNTVQKEIDGYTFENSTGATTGKIEEGEKEVIYYYTKANGGNVTVKYVDEEGNEIADPEIIKGKVNDPYETKLKEIENYEFEKTTGDEPKGNFGSEPKEVIYHYKKLPGKVIVKYLEKGTDKELAEQTIVEGKVKDSYETQRKVIEGYRKADPEPKNSKGTITKETITVIYYYEKIPSGKVTVKYVDIDTKQEIEQIVKPGEVGNEEGKEEIRKPYKYELSGFVGEKYKTEEKEIPYYTYLKDLEPVNKEGLYAQNDDTVIYYYRKLPFNMSINKYIKEASINGDIAKIEKDGKIIKLEVVASKIGASKVQVKYAIIVTNTGDIEGTADVNEIIPAGFKLADENPDYWKEQKDGSLLTTVSLKAKESKELEVVLNWKNGSSNFGSFVNKVKIADTNNPANYVETTTDDNESESTAVISIKTGIETKVLVIALGAIASCGLLVLLYEYQKYQKERNKEIRHVVLEGKNVVIKKKLQK